MIPSGVAELGSGQSFGHKRTMGSKQRSQHVAMDEGRRKIVQLRGGEWRESQNVREIILNAMLT